MKAISDNLDKLQKFLNTTNEILNSKIAESNKLGKLNNLIRIILNKVFTDDIIINMKDNKNKLEKSLIE